MTRGVVAAASAKARRSPPARGQDCAIFRRARRRAANSRASARSKPPSDSSGPRASRPLMSGRDARGPQELSDPAMARGAGEIELYDQVVVVAVAAAISIFPAPGAEAVVPQMAAR